MALSVGPAALARAKAEIREPTALDKEARRALNQADQLLGDLQELQLRGDTDVPSFCSRSAMALRWASLEAGTRDRRLESESGVIKLMDDVYTLEERLMRRLRVRTVGVVSRRS
jgi:hypothetical protein